MFQCKLVACVTAQNPQLYDRDAETLAEGDHVDLCDFCTSSSRISSHAGDTTRLGTLNDQEEPSMQWFWLFAVIAVVGAGALVFGTGLIEIGGVTQPSTWSTK